jgi:hypothetical protein
MAIGVFGKAPIIIGLSAALALVVGILLPAGGLQEFDGSYNSTYAYHNATNTSISGVVRVENFIIHQNNNTVWALGIILMLIGLTTFLYAATLIKHGPPDEREG